MKKNGSPGVEDAGVLVSPSEPTGVLSGKDIAMARAGQIQWWAGACEAAAGLCMLGITLSPIRSSTVQYKSSDLQVRAIQAALEYFLRKRRYHRDKV
ncbi:MAG: hypothetical protein JSU94_19360 [Phycisphaerales bacterium]|nr:MAG: hypothetical protein JSU94_19360 [Phycisphaerales bacterium]